jgi:hypothetical protein
MSVSRDLLQPYLDSGACADLQEAESAFLGGYTPERWLAEKQNTPADGAIRMKSSAEIIAERQAQYGQSSPGFAPADFQEKRMRAKNAPQAAPPANNPLQQAPFPRAEVPAGNAAAVKRAADAYAGKTAPNITQPTQRALSGDGVELTTISRGDVLIELSEADLEMCRKSGYSVERLLAERQYELANPGKRGGVAMRTK